jgi:hypothetical protein
MIDHHPSCFVNGITHLAVAFLRDGGQTFGPVVLIMALLEGGYPFVVPLIQTFEMFAIPDKAIAYRINTGEPIINPMVNAHGLRRVHINRLGLDLVDKLCIECPISGQDTNFLDRFPL